MTGLATGPAICITNSWSMAATSIPLGIDFPWLNPVPQNERTAFTGYPATRLMASLDQKATAAVCSAGG